MRPQHRTAPRRSWGPWIAAAIAVVAVVSATVMVSSQPTGPRVGDHWHAPFKVVICGERTPPLPATEGDVHTHGDDVIHVHPHSRDTAGRNATIGAFLKTTPLEVTTTSLTIKTKVYRNGDRCADGRAGTVIVLVNGKPRSDVLSYTPTDGDQIEFRFGP
jgi:hypothetical protein